MDDRAIEDEVSSSKEDKALPLDSDRIQWSSVR